jgi:environmental stress-induced protein Ves
VTPATGDARTFDVAALPAAAWRNGQGTARELAAAPPGASLTGFDWRVAVAEIEPGATSFSRFPGIERLLVATGPGLRLGHAGCGGTAMREVEPWVPVRLDGDEPVDARLVGSRLRVFNVMSRRGVVRGAAAVHRRTAPLPEALATVLWCVHGRCGFGPAEGRTTALETNRAAVLPGEAMLLHIGDDATVVLAATFHA